MYLFLLNILAYFWSIFGSLGITLYDLNIWGQEILQLLQMD
ncbi:MAG: hypothetical protein AAFQ87_10565 [Bacteroidota bacterium]